LSATLPIEDWHQLMSTLFRIVLLLFIIAEVGKALLNIDRVEKVRAAYRATIYCGLLIFLTVGIHLPEWLNYTLGGISMMLILASLVKKFEDRIVQCLMHMLPRR
jgi:hypothetical protein